MEKRNKNTNQIIKRHDDGVKYLLKHFPCVAILGARQVGKTTLLRQILPNAPFFDLELSSDFEIINADPDFFLKQHDKPIVIDEAQLSPQFFKALRVRIDKQRKKNGQFLLSGSSSPNLLANLAESLAGRVGIYELGPLLTSEKQERKISSFYNFLVEKKWSQFSLLESAAKFDILDEILWGGYPEPFLAHEQKFKRIWFENYIRTYIDRDIRRLFPDLSMEIYRRFIQMLAYSSSQIINQSQMAATLGVSAPTVGKYLDIAEGTFLFRKWPAFGASDPNKAFTKNPKGSIRDTGLICSFLKIYSKRDLFSHPMLGGLFETWVIETILRSLQSTLSSCNFFHVRTRNQAEIDFILEGEMGRVPVEIKFGSTVRRESLSFLRQFMKSHKSEVGFLINNSEAPAMISENIIQIPAACL